MQYKILNNGCWGWVKAKTNHGYGQLWDKELKKVIYAHRYYYELYKGKIPEGLQIDHLCRNRDCVNPEHLEAVSMKENVLRGTGQPAINAKKTHCKYGHEFVEQNIYHIPTGGRACRTCRRTIKLGLSRGVAV